MSVYSTCYDYKTSHSPSTSGEPLYPDSYHDHSQSVYSPAHSYNYPSYTPLYNDQYPSNHVHYTDQYTSYSDPNTGYEIQDEQLMYPEEEPAYHPPLMSHDYKLASLDNLLESYDRASTPQTLFPTPSELLCDLASYQHQHQHDQQHADSPPDDSLSISGYDSSQLRARQHRDATEANDRKTESQRKARRRAMDEELGFHATDPDTISSHDKKRHYLECLEHYVTYLHEQIRLIGTEPLPFERVPNYRGLSSKSIRTLLVHMQNTVKKLHCETLDQERVFLDLSSQVVALGKGTTEQSDKWHDLGTGTQITSEAPYDLPVSYRDVTRGDIIIREQHGARDEVQGSYRGDVGSYREQDSYHEVVSGNRSLESQSQSQSKSQSQSQRIRDAYTALGCPNLANSQPLPHTGDSGSYILDSEPASISHSHPHIRGRDAYSLDTNLDSQQSHARDSGSYPLDTPTALCTGSVTGLPMSALPSDALSVPLSAGYSSSFQDHRMSWVR